MTRSRSGPRSKPLQAWLLALLLLAAQALGLAHRIQHAPGPGAAPAAAAVAAAPASWADGHDAGGAECRLIDQLAHADGLCDATWAAAPVPPATEAHEAAPTVAPRAGSASAYLARAPPLA